MKNPFEAPKKKAPQEDESVDVDFSDIGSTEELIVRGLGEREKTPEEIAARHEALGRELAPERERAEREVEMVAERFLKGNQLFAKRHGGDAAFMRRFKNGLPDLVRTKGTAFGYRDDATRMIDVEALLEDERFLKALNAYSIGFEDAERAA